MPQKTLVCIPILEKERESVLKTASRAISMGADILELRIDGIVDPDPQEVVHIIEEIDFPLIATNRMKEEGGYFLGSEDNRAEILIEAAKCADYIDLELQTAVKYRSEIIKAARSTIISFHDFQKTPHIKELLSLVEEEKKLGDIAKFAVMPQNMQDTLNVLEVLAHVDNTIGISMGKLGRYTRVLGSLFGSPITYASLNEDVAPGQLNIQDTKLILDKLGDYL